MAADRDQAGRRGAARCGVCLLAALLGGCGPGATGTGSRPGADPLAGPATPSVGAPGGGVPPLPAPSGSTTPAALATGTVPSFNAARPGSSGPAGVWREPTSGAILGAPEPARGTQPSGPLTLMSGPGSVQTIDQGLKALELRGAKGFRLELQRDTGQWRCSCSVPNRQNPAYKQTYDTTAADPLSAVRAVVDQIARENP
jgi:hypothetical protein